MGAIFKTLSKLTAMAALCLALTACGDQAPEKSDKPSLEEAAGHPEDIPASKKDCAILGVLCR